MVLVTLGYKLHQLGILQISATCKQTIYKQTGWRGAPELSNGAGWRQRAQAMAAKQCRLLAAGGKKF